MTPGGSVSTFPEMACLASGRRLGWDKVTPVWFNCPVSMTARRSNAAPILALLALILLPLAAYVGAYCCLLQPSGYVRLEEEHVNPPHLYAHYRLGGETAKQFFGPVHWIDRGLRPDRWTVEFRTLGNRSFPP